MCFQISLRRFLGNTAWFRPRRPMRFMMVAGIAFAIGMLSHSAWAAKQKIGTMTLAYKGGMRYAGGTLDLFGGFTATSETIDLSGQTINISLVSKRSQKGGPSIARATAVGDPDKGTQVTGRFVDTLRKQTILMSADKAVYVPEPDRPGGGRVDFTGHVKVVIIAPLSLAEPSETTTDHAVILLGTNDPDAEPKYPQVETGPGHITLTPLDQTNDKAGDNKPAPPK
jgi:hypothetical protein